MQTILKQGYKKTIAHKTTITADNNMTIRHVDDYVYLSWEQHIFIINENKSNKLNIHTICML